MIASADPTRAQVSPVAAFAVAHPERVGAMVGALEACIKDNLSLHRQIDDLMQRQMQAEGWMYTSGSSSDLSLR